MLQNNPVQEAQNSNETMTPTSNHQSNEELMSQIPPPLQSIPRKKLTKSEYETKIASKIKISLGDRLDSISKNQTTFQTSIDSISTQLSRITTDADKIYNFMVKTDTIKQSPPAISTPTVQLPSNSVLIQPSTAVHPNSSATIVPSVITSTPITLSTKPSQSQQSQTAAQLLQQVQLLAAQKTIPASLILPKLAPELESIKESLPTVVSASLYSPRVLVDASSHAKISHHPESHNPSQEVAATKHKSHTNTLAPPLNNVNSSSNSGNLQNNTNQQNHHQETQEKPQNTSSQPIQAPKKAITQNLDQNSQSNQQQQLQSQQQQPLQQQPQPQQQQPQQQQPLPQVPIQVPPLIQDTTQDAIQMDALGKGKVIPKIMDLKTLRNMARNKSSDNAAANIIGQLNSSFTELNNGNRQSKRGYDQAQSGGGSTANQSLVEENWAACDEDDENLLDYNSRGKDDVDTLEMISQSSLPTQQINQTTKTAPSGTTATTFSEEKFNALLERFTLDQASLQDIQQYCQQYLNKKDALCNALVFFTIELQNKIEAFEQANPNAVLKDKLKWKQTTNTGIQLISLDLINELLVKETFEENILAMFDVLFMLLLSASEYSKYASSSAVNKEDFIREYMKNNYESFTEIVIKIEDVSVDLNGNYPLKKAVKKLIEKYPILLSQKDCLKFDSVCAMLSPAIDEICMYFGIKETKLNKPNVIYFEYQFHKSLSQKVKELNPIIQDLD